jgi:hypothetical protein
MVNEPTYALNAEIAAALGIFCTTWKFSTLTGYRGNVSRNGGSEQRKGQEDYSVFERLHSVWLRIVVQVKLMAGAKAMTV